MLIVVPGLEDEFVVRSVSASDEAYLRRAVEPAFVPMTDDEYMEGPAKQGVTAVRDTYILDGTDVWWCIEPDSKPVVVRMSPDGSFAAAALTSPIPLLDGREAGAYDDGAPQSQDIVVADVSDDRGHERTPDWRVADVKTRQMFAAAVDHASALHRITPQP